MYTPHEGELVRIVADHCQHGLRVGSLITIHAQHSPGKWWVRDRDIYVTPQDIARLKPGTRKSLKNLEKAIKFAIDDIPTDLPNRKLIIIHVLRTHLDEVDR